MINHTSDTSLRNDSGVIKKEDWQKLMAAWFPPACFVVAVPGSGSKLLLVLLWHALVGMVGSE
jgi:hypothetical protein